MIRIIWIRNPLQPSSTREIHLVEPAKEAGTLERYISDELYKGGEVPAEIVGSLNGKVIERDQWKTITPRDEDCIVLAPLLHGGSVWRTLAQVAVIAGAAV